MPSTAPAVLPLPLVSTEWLAARLGEPGVSVVDGSFYLPAMKRDAAQEYAVAHIPGAVRFDVDEICDHTNPLPHMLPGPEQFSAAVGGTLGISDRDTIVVYDGHGMFSSPRVWWTFRLFGAENVFVLQGGFPCWKAEGRPTAGGPVSRPPKHFAARQPPAIVADAATVQAALASGSAQVVDVRPANRFRGEAPEPRPGIRTGHAPGSLNVPQSNLLENGHLLPPDRLREVLAAGGVDIDKPIIVQCGSGVSSATLCLALHILGKPPVTLYDGSWTDWGGRSDLPVVTGPA